MKQRWIDVEGPWIDQVFWNEVLMGFSKSVEAKIDGYTFFGTADEALIGGVFILIQYSRF
jgi:hypothetical protein